MRLLSLLTLATLTLPSSLWAQDSLKLDLPLGQISLTQGPDLAVEILAEDGSRISVETAFLPQIKAQHENSVLLEIYSGGNACPADYLWLTLTPKGFATSPVFGTCSEGAEIVATEGYPSVLIEGFGSDLTRYRYDFDGVNLSESQGMPSEEAGEAPDLAAWEGKSARDFVRDAHMRPALEALLGPDRIEIFTQAVEMGGAGDAFRGEGEWLIGGGCDPLSFGQVCGQIALSPQSGAILAALEEVGEITPFGTGAPALFGTFAPAVEQLAGSWVIAMVEGADPRAGTEKEPLTISFEADGRLQGRLHCNALMGKVQIEKRILALTEIATTRMACPEMAEEARLLGLLEDVQRWVATDEGLELRSKTGEVILLRRGG